MSNFDAVFDVCVALQRGETLRGGQEPGAPAWGIIDCEQALGAFDARSPAWHSDVDGVPHRFTREEAEDRARRLNGSSWDGRVCAALELPERPRSATVGTYHRATDTELQFACLDWSNGGTDIAIGSAFDAAYAFVGFVGERAAYRAVIVAEAEASAA